MTRWICFAYWQSSFARKTVCFERDKEALPPPASLRAGLRSAARLSAPVLGPLSLSPPHQVAGWRRSLPASGNGANIVQVSSLAPPPQPKRRPRSWLLHFVAPAAPALWQLPPGRHRFTASSPAGVHTPLRSGSLLPSTLPITHARGTGSEETTQELIGTLPPDPLPPL